MEEPTLFDAEVHDSPYTVLILAADVLITALLVESLCIAFGLCIIRCTCHIGQSGSATTHVWHQCERVPHAKLICSQRPGPTLPCLILSAAISPTVKETAVQLAQPPTW